MQMNTSSHILLLKNSIPSENQIKLFFDSCYAWKERAKGFVQQSARIRILLIALLIRHMGLRLCEVLAFQDITDLDAVCGIIHVRGRWARELPVPSAVLKKSVNCANIPVSFGRGENYVILIKAICVVLLNFVLRKQVLMLA
jgi:hypothetical protein